MTNPFWDFSLASYSRDGVPESCLALQDDLNLDVNVLLYGAWLASQDKRLSDGTPGCAGGRNYALEGTGSGPLRALRRQLAGISASGRPPR